MSILEAVLILPVWPLLRSLLGIYDGTLIIIFDSRGEKKKKKKQPEVKDPAISHIMHKINCFVDRVFLLQHLDTFLKVSTASFVLGFFPPYFLSSLPCLTTHFNWLLVND